MCPHKRVLPAINLGRLISVTLAKVLQERYRDMGVEQETNDVLPRLFHKEAGSATGRIPRRVSQRRCMARRISTAFGRRNYPSYLHDPCGRLIEGAGGHRRRRPGRSVSGDAELHLRRIGKRGSPFFEPPTLLSPPAAEDDLDSAIGGCYKHHMKTALNFTSLLSFSFFSFPFLSCFSLFH